MKVIFQKEKVVFQRRKKKREIYYEEYSGEDSGKQLDFSQTGISKVYFEFQNRGIKCC